MKTYSKPFFSLEQRRERSSSAGRSGRGRRRARARRPTRSCVAGATKSDGSSVGEEDVAEGRPPDEAVVDAPLDGARAHADAGARVALRIHVEEQRLLLGGCHARREVHRRRRLPDAPLLVHDRDDAAGGASVRVGSPSWVRGRRGMRRPSTIGREPAPQWSHAGSSPPRGARTPASGARKSTRAFWYDRRPKYVCPTCSTAVATDAARDFSRDIMASLVARALVEDPRSSAGAGSHDHDRGVERVLLGTFWRPSSPAAPAQVISIASRRGAPRTPPTRG